MPALTRRGPAVNAGRMCPYKRNSHACTQYARYEIARVNGDAIETVTIGCGTHTLEAVRRVWQEFNVAAVIREIPGMWRYDK